jgi:hypothetical protein
LTAPPKTTCVSIAIMCKRKPVMANNWVDIKWIYIDVDL